MSEYKMVDYGNIYETILADNRQMRARIVQLEKELAELALRAKPDAQGEWQPVEYDDIYTPQAEPIRIDYENICDKWHTFNESGCDTDDGYEYAICRKHIAPVEAPPVQPTIVVLCGSTRFWRQFQISGLEETLAGKIVLSIGSASGTDDDHFGHLSKEEHDRIVKQLNELHLHKIDMADEVLILNLGGYIGIHTQAELDYARKLGKYVRFLEPEQQRPAAEAGA